MAIKKCLYLSLILFSYLSFSQNEINHAIQQRDMDRIKFGSASQILVGEIKNNFFINLVKYHVNFRLDNNVNVDYIYKFSYLNVKNKLFTDIRIIYMTEDDVNRLYNFIIGEFVKSKQTEQVAFFDVTDLESGKFMTKYFLMVKFTFDDKGLFKVYFQSNDPSNSFPSSELYSLNQITKLFGKN